MAVPLSVCLTCHRLYCRREGTRPPVVLLHGLAGSWRYWRRGLDGLTQRHTLYGPDLLGFGRSPKPRGDYSIAMHVNALTGLVDEIHGDIVMAQHSMGAILALAAYARRPARVSRIVLKVKPTAMAAPTGNPCAAKNPSAPKE